MAETPKNSPNQERFQTIKGRKKSFSFKNSIGIVNETKHDIYLVVGADPNMKKLESVTVGLGQTKAQLGLRFIHANGAKDQLVCVRPKSETEINIDGTQAYVSAECHATITRCLLFGDRLVHSGQVVTIIEDHIQHPFEWEYTLF